MRYLIVVAMLLLSACSGEPSEAALRKAFEKDFKKNSQPANSQFGQSKLYSLEKLACREAGKVPGYVCDVQIDAALPLIGRGIRNMAVRMVKTDDGWTVVGVVD